MKFLMKERQRMNRHSIVWLPVGHSNTFVSVGNYSDLLYYRKCCEYSTLRAHSTLRAYRASLVQNKAKRLLLDGIKSFLVGDCNYLGAVCNNTDLLNVTSFFRLFSSERSLRTDIMFKPLPSKYVRSYDKPIYVYLGSINVPENEVVNRFENVLQIGDVYTVFVKLRFDTDQFIMAGNQFGFHYINYSNLINAFATIEERVQTYMANYEIDDESLVYIQIGFKKRDKVLLEEIGIDENITHVERKVKESDKQLLKIPVSIEKDYLGGPLAVEVKDGLITNVILKIDFKNINFMDLIKLKSSFLPETHVDKISSLDSNYSFFLVRKEKSNPFILAIKVKDKSVDKIMFSLNGVNIDRVTDVFYDDYIERLSRNKKNYY